MNIIDRIQLWNMKQQFPELNKLVDGLELAFDGVNPSNRKAVINGGEQLFDDLKEKMSHLPASILWWKPAVETNETMEMYSMRWKQLEPYSRNVRTVDLELRRTDSGIEIVQTRCV